MPCFSVQYSGTNFLLDLDGEHGKFGFQATRLIKAASAAEVEKKALILIHQELNHSLHIIKNTPDVPRVVVESIQKAGLLRCIKSARYQGFEFFREAEPSE